MAEGTTQEKLGLLDRLARGPVICAEGYLFEFERRGYLQAGAFVPEVVLDHPELVAQLHREFVHAGSDVVEAFTYYAHREKLRLVGLEDRLEPLNRQALAIAGGVARETGTLFAGDLFGDGQGLAVHLFQEVFLADDTQLLAVRVVRECLDDVGAGAHEFAV